MIVRSSTLVVSEKEDGILPCGATHKSIHDVGYLRLPGQDRLARTRMLVIVAITGLDEGETGQRAVGKVAEVGRQRSNVIGIDAEGVGRIPNDA